MIWTVSKYPVWLTQKPRKGDFGELKCQKFAGKPCPQTTREVVNWWKFLIRVWLYPFCHWIFLTWVCMYLFIYLELIEREPKPQENERASGKAARSWGKQKTTSALEKTFPTPCSRGSFCVSIAPLSRAARVPLLTNSEDVVRDWPECCHLLLCCAFAILFFFYVILKDVLKLSLFFFLSYPCKKLCKV